LIQQFLRCGDAAVYDRTQIDFDHTQIDFKRTQIDFKRTQIDFKRTQIDFDRTQIDFEFIRQNQIHTEFISKSNILIYIDQSSKYSKKFELFEIVRNFQNSSKFSK